MGYKHALVLSGGGANGAYQNGVVERLAEAIEDGEYPEPDLIIGTSVGALNGSKLCEFPMGNFSEAAAALNEEWERLSGNEDIYKPHFWGLIPSVVLAGLKWTKSIYNTSAIQKHVRENLHTDKMKSSGRHFVCNAVEFQGSGKTAWFETGHPRLADGVLASSSYPIFFEPIKIDGVWYTDGGIRDQTAIGKAISMGAERIDVISCSSGSTSNVKDLPKGLDQIQRMIEIMLHEIDTNDFERARLINEQNGWKSVVLNELRPSERLGSGLDFSAAKNSKLKSIGWLDADRFLSLK
jgi:predicted acylesterase/phospholipase RssA